MYNALVKMKNKKGFTLVEMLVVIAIIAILVSIVVPVVGQSTQKARAATNAANLRSIEGKIATMRVERPELFVAALDKLGQELSALEYAAAEIVAYLAGTDVEHLLMGDNAFGDYVRYQVCHETANEAGVLTFTIGDGYDNITVTDVPTAVAVDVDGMTVAEGTRMTVYISDVAILATYESGSNSYTKMDFSEVAETGKFSGSSGSGGSTNAGVTGNLTQAVSCAFGDHAESNSHICPACNRADPDHAACITGGEGYTCGYDDCEKGVHPSSGCIDDDDDDYQCEVPGCSNIVHPDAHVNDGSNHCDVDGCQWVYVTACGCTRGYDGFFGFGADGKCDACNHNYTLDHSDSGALKDCKFAKGGWFLPSDIH